MHNIYDIDYIICKKSRDREKKGISEDLVYWRYLTSDVLIGFVRKLTMFFFGER